MARGKKSLGKLRKRNGWYHLDYETPLGRVREAANTKDEREAKELLGRRIGDVASGKIQGPSKVTVSTLLSLLVSDYEDNERHSTHDLRCRIESTINPLIGKMRASEVTPVTIRSYIKRREAAKAARATIRRELANIKRAFKLGMLNELIFRMPVFPTIGGDNIREGFVDFFGSNWRSSRSARSSHGALTMPRAG
jgi:hypothetical protein